MKALILRSVCFDDAMDLPQIHLLEDEYKSKEYDVAVYDMPASDNAEHWAGFAVTDYTSFSDILVCVDFPVALIKHPRKRIVLTKPLPTAAELQKAIQQAFSEAENTTEMK